jgi:4'-phosphopantetheinyl transferase
MRPLSQGSVRVFYLALEDDGNLPALWSLLDEDERTRAGRFAAEKSRRRFVMAHGQMRVILGAVLDESAADIRFSRAEYGKPFVSDRRIDLRFSLSHSGERALLALAVGREIGVDIEQCQAVDVLELARQCFSRREYGTLQLLPASQRLDAFYRGWTRKESLVKARGDGLFCPLRDFDVNLEEASGDLLVGWRLADDDGGRWAIRSLPVDAVYAAAITVEGGSWEDTSGGGWELVDRCPELQTASLGDAARNRTERSRPGRAV